MVFAGVIYSAHLPSSALNIQIKRIVLFWFVDSTRRLQDFHRLLNLIRCADEEQHMLIVASLR